MDENGLKYMSRTNLHFDIGLGWLVHENFFTAAKLRFLAGPASLLFALPVSPAMRAIDALPVQRGDLPEVALQVPLRRTSVERSASTSEYTRITIQEARGPRAF